MLASLELNRNISTKSGKSMKSIKSNKKKTSVYESVFGKGKLKIRQAQSIREPEEDEDHVSIVISSSSFMNNSLFGQLLPIREM
jgi:stress-induced morphogen